MSYLSQIYLQNVQTIKCTFNHGSINAMINHKKKEKIHNCHFV